MAMQLSTFDCFSSGWHKLGDAEASDDDAASTRSTASGSHSEKSNGSSRRPFVWADEDSDDDFDVSAFLPCNKQQSEANVSSVPQMPPGCNQLFQMGGVNQHWTMTGVGQTFIPYAPSPCFMLQHNQMVAPACQPTWSATEEVSSSQTTLILKNLPLGCSHEGVRKILDEAGLAGLYNFIYVPYDFKKSSLLRYGFVNFEQNASALKAIAALDGFSDWEGEKACEVRWSGAQQGLHAHVERYRNSPVMHKDVPDEYKPVVFENGVRVAFPAPTKTLKPLKLRKAYQA